MPASVRRLLLAAAASAVGALVVYLFARRASVAWWDERALEVLGGRLRNYRIVEGSDALRDMFDLVPYAMLVAVLLASALYRRLLGAAGLVATMLLAANLSTWALQHRLSEPRVVVVLNEPPWMSYWPSGHATAAAALAFAVFLLSAPRWRPFVAVTAVVATVPAAVTNLVLRVHVPSDVAGGVLVAATWGFLALAAQRAWPQLQPR